MGLTQAKTTHLVIRKAIFIVLPILAANFFAASTVYAATLIDHIAVSKTNKQEAIQVYFNLPVFYLFHTPDKKADSTLIGIKLISQNTKIKTYQNAVTTGHSEYLSDMEIFSEAGFNTHLYLQFRKTVNISVKQGPKMRSIIIQLTPYK